MVDKRNMPQEINPSNIEERPLHTFPSGAKYIGYWRKGTQVCEGYGIFVAAGSTFDGDIFEGYWWDNWKHGLGRYISREGDWYFGKYHKGQRIETG